MSDFQKALDEVSTKRHRGLLVIDDEENILKALRRQFRRDYDVHTARSAHKGLEVMRNESIAVIISDQRMPEMSGSEFFSEVRHQHPRAIRLLLTGYADLKGVIAAINEGSIFRYITKPWDPVELDTIVREAFERHDLIMRNEHMVEALQAANATLEDRVELRTRQLDEANEELQALNRRKDEIVGVVAHDLRSPLAGIQQCLEVIRTTEEAEIREEFFGMIGEVSEKMMGLINELLDISAIESGRVELVMEEVDLPAFAERIMRTNRPAAEGKGIELRCDVPGDVGTARFDFGRIEQVVDNLISNALKFSHSGTRVDFEIGREDRETRLRVCDQGPGISEEEQQKLFQQFARGANQPTAGEHSTGLGLSICRRIVELHGGSIAVSSKVGSGAAFTVVLPDGGDDPSLQPDTPATG